MATARAVQISVTHLAFGIAVGSLLEAFMPAHSASASDAVTAFEAFVQVALNGVLLSQVGAQLGADDPTFGLPFSWGIFVAQPGLRKRIELLSAQAERKILEFAPKMPELSLTAAPPSQDS